MPAYDYAQVSRAERPWPGFDDYSPPSGFRAEVPTLADPQEHGTPSAMFHQTPQGDRARSIRPIGEPRGRSTPSPW